MQKTSQDDETQEELVCVKTTSSAAEAEMLGVMLESFGIWALVKADDIGGAYPGVTYAMPARVYVRRADESQAMQLLTEA